LELRDPLVLVGGHGLPGSGGGVLRDDERTAGASRGHAGLHVGVVELRDPAVRHLLGELPEFLRGGIVVDALLFDGHGCPSSYLGNAKARRSAQRLGFYPRGTSGTIRPRSTA